MLAMIFLVGVRVAQIMTEYDGWTVVLHEMMMHVQKFVVDNPMEYKGKELKA